jgi:elongator complex protein 3
MRKLARTISGVTPVAVMTQPVPCPGQCIYCPTFADIPQSYTPESPVVLRGIKHGFDAKKQVDIRMKTLADMGHPLDKIELIVMGGTFLATPLDYQQGFIKGCYDALNGQEAATLEEAKHRNETAQKRCVGLCIETRPDWCGQQEIQRMLDFGATRVELGVQILDDKVYELVKRGHKIADVEVATRRLKEHGLKVHYHWMPGLPGLTPEKDLELAMLLFKDIRFRPDGLKLYPTMVVTGTVLEKLWRQGCYKPYPDETMIGLILDIKKIVPSYVRISRVLRDIPARYIVAGLKDSLRDLVKERMDNGIGCHCIRCREYGRRAREGWSISKPKLVRRDYEASGGHEVFLSFEDKGETLFGLLRLRIQQKHISNLGLIEGEKLALVRELHIYGPEVSLGERQETAVQHRGMGKALLRAAEEIAVTEFGAAIVAVLSGVGAREYYAGLGYNFKSGYMIKKLIPKRDPSEY